MLIIYCINSADIQHRGSSRAFLPRVTSGRQFFFLFYNFFSNFINFSFQFYQNISSFMSKYVLKYLDLSTVCYKTIYNCHVIYISILNLAKILLFFETECIINSFWAFSQTWIYIFHFGLKIPLNQLNTQILIPHMTYVQAAIFFQLFKRNFPIFQKKIFQFFTRSIPNFLDEPLV